jgi:hypothetical protein
MNVMTRRHTPAPWRWFTRRDPETGIETQETGVKMRTLIGANGQGFAWTVGLSPEVDMANADLMSAAPTMLEALERADQFIRNGVELGYIRMPDPDSSDSALQTPGIIRAAIAAATGEEVTR